MIANHVLDLQQLLVAVGAVSVNDHRIQPTRSSRDSKSKVPWKSKPLDDDDDDWD